MGEANAKPFLDVVTACNRINTIYEEYKTNEGIDRIKSTKVSSLGRKKYNKVSVKETVLDTCAELNKQADVIGIKVTKQAIDRLVKGLEEDSCTIEDLGQLSCTIQSRLSDELHLIKVHVIRNDVARYFDAQEPLFGQEVAKQFPSASYEIAESGNCLALARSTASVFHLMRTMEIALRAIALCLGIPVPTKEVEYYWADILGLIRANLVVRNAADNLSAPDRAFFESAYASLDAVRVAWRNATMNVESKYTEDEAEHIFRAVRQFMRSLASGCDETGQPYA